MEPVRRVVRNLLPIAGISACAHLAAPSHAAERSRSTLSAATVSTSAPGNGLIEIREYTLRPEGVNAFMMLAKDSAHLRLELLPLLGMFTCDLGGTLNRIIHLYKWRDFDERDERRHVASRNKWWVKYLSESRLHVHHQASSIFVEAAPVYAALGHPGAAHYVTPPASDADLPARAIYELRTTQLLPGYGSVPKLVEAFAAGLPKKVAACHEGELALFGYSEVGTLNNVVELWRYPSAQSCARARQASRGVPEWRETIGAITPGVQQFTTSLLRPVAFSPWQ